MSLKSIVYGLLLLYFILVINKRLLGGGNSKPMLHLVKVANPFIVLVMRSLMVIYFKRQQREQQSLPWLVAAHTETI